ncbi:MAG: hypothetical protein CMF52_07350 [Legionellales bacterium]|nr:hypothetical protein [Legionellales bacterium]
MAYNNLSGTVLAPHKLIPRKDRNGDIIVPIVSGNLSTSDGASILNVPRLANATNNAIVTNVDGDANSLICESNLTFDGETLNIVGDLTASAGLSASFLYGDGRYLTNISGSGGNASGQGPNGSLQFKTSEGSGTISGSSNLLFQNNILKLGGSLKLGRTSVSSSYTAATTDFFVGADTSNAAFQITLADAAQMLDGQMLVIKDEGGAANNNNITVAASGSQTIDGQNQVILESPYASIQLYCNGNNKYFIF